MCVPSVGGIYRSGFFKLLTNDWVCWENTLYNAGYCKIILAHTLLITCKSRNILFFFISEYQYNTVCCYMKFTTWWLSVCQYIL